MKQLRKVIFLYRSQWNFPLFSVTHNIAKGQNCNEILVPQGGKLGGAIKSRGVSLEGGIFPFTIVLHLVEISTSYSALLSSRLGSVSLEAAPALLGFLLSAS